MKWFRKPFFIDVLIFAVISLVMFSIAGTYQSYRTYSKPQHYQDVPALIETLNGLLYHLEEERIDTAAYIAQQRKYDFSDMRHARMLVDRGVERFEKVLSGEAAFASYRKELKSIYLALLETRSLVDDFGTDPMEILFHRYHSKVAKPLIDLLRMLELATSDRSMKAYLSAYTDLMHLRENTVLEHSGIYYLLLRKRPMRTEERHLWERIVASDTLPDFQTLPDVTLAVDLRALMSKKQYDDLLSSERNSIAKGASSGQYSVTTVQWLEKIEKKLTYFAKAGEMLVSKIAASSHHKSLHTVNLVLMYGLASLILLIMLWKLFRVRSHMRENRKLYEDTQRDIELIFDKEQQKKLKRLIENGNVDHIYRFLIQAIKDANRTKDLFLAGMSHEIRTPLNGILGFTQLLKETELNAQQQEFLSVVEKSSDHLLRIVNDILDLSKIKAEKIELELITFDPLEVFEAAVESYSGKAQKSQIDYQVFIDPALPVALIGDPTKISQIIVNLVSNAIKFTPEHGTVSVEIVKSSESDESCTLHFAISDTGIGISKEERKKIFAAFGQADVSTSRKYGGTGLGLSISGRLIERMGGKLGIRSIKGEGATFHFTLTLQKDTTAEKERLAMRYEEEIGILDPHLDLEYFPNTNLEKYVAYAGAKVIHFTDRSFFQAKENGTLPKLMFIDHKYRMREGELTPFLDIDSRIIVLSTIDQKEELSQHSKAIEKIIYKPVTFTKTIKALFGVDQEEEAKKELHFKDLHILVAEDNAINQRLLENVLTRMGVKVTLVNNGREAVQKRKESSRYDVIFMDIEMPDMGGMEATAQILAFERSSGEAHIPIIALTANALAGDKAKYTGAGMDGYLAKPIDLDLLRSLLEEAFPQKRV